MYLSISACSNFAPLPTATPNLPPTSTLVPSFVPSLTPALSIPQAPGSVKTTPPPTATPNLLATPVPPIESSASPTFNTLQVPGLVKTTLEFYRGGKTYEIIVGYAVGDAFLYATPPPEIPLAIFDKLEVDADLERYGDFDNDGETEYIVSLVSCKVYCYETIHIYEYDSVTDSFYIADKFGASAPAIDSYTDLNNDGEVEIITANYGYCFQCAHPVASLATFMVLRYENGKFIDVSNEFPDLIQQEADEFLKLARENAPNSTILLAAYLYNMYRVGKIDEARLVFNQVCEAVLAPSRSNSDDELDCNQLLIDVEKSAQEVESKK